jgi:hypothetical protein
MGVAAVTVPFPKPIFTIVNEQLRTLIPRNFTRDVDRFALSPVRGCQS